MGLKAMYDLFTKSPIHVGGRQVREDEGLGGRALWDGQLRAKDRAQVTIFQPRRQGEMETG